MTKRQIAKEWKRLNYEIFVSKPKTDSPYPLNIVRRRELLLYAQIHLAEISWVKECGDFETKKFHTPAYYSAISKYYGQ